MSFEKMILCKGFTNSLIDIHKSSLKSSNLFGTTSLDSCLTQNCSFYWKLRKMWTDQNMVPYYLKRKWDFDSKDSKWIFKIDFRMDFFEKKYFILRIKEINLKTTKHKKQNTKQNKRKQNHKVKFLTTKQTKVVRMEPKFSIISPLNQALHSCCFSTNSPLILTVKKVSMKVQLQGH